MATTEQWKQFHYPKRPKVKPKNPIAYKLIDLVSELPTHAKGDGMGFKGQRSN